MKKRTAFIGAILSLIPLGQPLIIKTGVALSSTGLMLLVSDNVYANDGVGYFNLGNEKADEGDHYGAISDFSKAIEIRPAVDAYNNRANRKVNIEDYYGAISDFNKALEMNPYSEIVFKNRGIAKEYLGDMKGACDDWRKASSLGNESTAEWVRDQC